MPEFWKTDIFKICAFVFGAIFIGAMLAPPFYWFGKSVVESGSLEGKSFLGIDLHDELERASLARYFNRAMLLGALVCLWPTIRWLGAKPSEFLQLDPNPRRWRHLGVGFGLAAGGFLIMGLILYQIGVFGPKTKDQDPLFEVISASLISAFAVGFLEEFFFRGCLLGLALRTTTRLKALIFVSVIFSALHFLKPPENTVYPDPVTWSSGFWLVGQIFAKFGNPVFFIAEFATLTAVGWVLGYATLRTRSIYLAVGLHAGWVFGIKVYGGLTERVLKLEQTQPWIGQDLKSGVVALIMVGATGALTWFWLNRFELGDRNRLRVASK